MKTVNVVAHAFDSLPGHVTISVRGRGFNLRAALCDAIREMFKDERLRRKRIDDFKLSVVVLTDREKDDA
jgi:hypothetical protein